MDETDAPPDIGLDAEGADSAGADGLADLPDLSADLGGGDEPSLGDESLPGPDAGSELGDLGSAPLAPDLGASTDGLTESQGNFDQAINELSGMGPGDDLGSVGAVSAAASNLILDIPVNVHIVLGKTQMSVGQLMELDAGSVVELKSKVGQPLEVVVNGRSIARGELTVMEDDESSFGVKVTEMIN